MIPIHGGYEPASGQRFAENVRWTGVLASMLGPDFRIIEEGLNARTTAFDDPVEGLHKNGRAYLLPCLESHAPLDLVIIMLGTNDLKQRFRLPASDIAEAAGSLVKSVASASPLDAIHLDARGHQALGQALAQEVKRILGE